MPKDSTINLTAHGVELALIAAMGLFTYSKYRALEKQIQELRQAISEGGTVSSGQGTSQLEQAIQKISQSSSANFNSIRDAFVNSNKQMADLDQRLQRLESAPKSALTTNIDGLVIDEEEDDDGVAPSPVAVSDGTESKSGGKTRRGRRRQSPTSH